MIEVPAPPTAMETPSLRAVWAMMIGFFVIVVDSTIVAVANPVIKQDFDATYAAVIWVTSAYLLVFAAFLLVGGRLGDRFGPKSMYLAGLGLFTIASLWCGLSESIGMLIGGRIAQGVGAALLTPQTLSAITRSFPPERRGVAMSVWGATAGVGMLVGPLAGGLLVDQLGWQWIFLANVPVGVAGLVLAVRLIPTLPGRPHRLDLFGVLLSGAGVCLIVLALQEGRNHDWAPKTWAMISGGLVLLAAFVLWQAVQRTEPLIPLVLFRHRDFGLSNAGIALISFAFVGFAVPLMFYLQEVRGLSAAYAGLVTAPMAIATCVFAPIVGRLVDRVQPRAIIGPGFAMLTLALGWLALEMNASAPIWRLAIPLTVIGVAGAFTWEPLAVTASRTLAPELSGAGSAVYNTVRQVGAVFGSAGIAALMAALVGAESADTASDEMSQAMLLPAFAAALGTIAALFFVGVQTAQSRPVTEHRPPRRNVSTAL